VKLSVAQQAGGQGGGQLLAALSAQGYHCVRRSTATASTAQQPQWQWQAFKKQSTSGHCGDSSRSVSNGTASRKMGQQESTDCRIGKKVRLQHQSKIKEEVCTGKDCNKNTKWHSERSSDTAVQ